MQSSDQPVMKPPVGLRLSNCLSCLARSSEVMAQMFGPPGKKPKSNQQKTSEQPNRLKTFRNKACYLQNKSLAFSRDKVRHTQLLPAWQGHYATQTCFPDVQPSWDNAPARLLQPGFQTSSVILQSWCRAVSCGCWLFAARAGCASPSPVWAKPSPGSLMSIQCHPGSHAQG